MSSPFQWLLSAFATIRRDPRTCVLGFAIIGVFGLVPTVVQLVVDLAAPGHPGAQAATMGLAVAYGVLVMPPLLGAGFRLVHAIGTGAPATPRDVLAGWADGDFARRMIAVSALLLLVNVLAFALLYAALPGKEFWTELFSRALATPPGAEPDLRGLPPFPASTFLWLLLAGFAVFVLGNAQMFAQVRTAMDGRTPAGAVADGFATTLRLFLPLVGFAIVACVVGSFLAFALGVVLAIVGVVAAAMGPLGAVVLIPFYLLLAVATYAVMFGFYYHAWREVFAGDAAPSPPAAIAA